MVSLLVLALASPLLASTEERVTLQVDGVRREAIVMLPDTGRSEQKKPIVFAFHGHGGSARNALRQFGIHTHWPEAIVVYMQGLTGVSGITDPDGKRTGWQKNPGDQQDRDVKFFDAMLRELASKHNVDSRRVYAMGHSNGSRFVCVLWKMRGDKLAAVSTSGGQGGVMLRGAKQLPFFAIAGEKDSLVPFSGQKLSIELLIKSYGMDPAHAKKQGILETVANKDGVEIVTAFHPGGHEWRRDLNKEIVTFFLRHAQKD